MAKWEAERGVGGGGGWKREKDKKKIVTDIHLTQAVE